jgi:hypothetical protein
VVWGVLPGIMMNEPYPTSWGTCRNAHDHRARDDDDPQIAAMVVGTIFETGREPIEAVVRARPRIAPQHAHALPRSHRHPLDGVCRDDLRGRLESPWLWPATVADRSRHTMSNVFVISNLADAVYCWTKDSRAGSALVKADFTITTLLRAQQV